MVCPNCGKENDAGTVFCIGCGARMPESPAQQNKEHYGEAPPQGGAYQPYNAPVPKSPDGVLGLGEFTLMELLARIPIVNLVMFCVWGFGGDVNENKRNWARSRLIWLGIGIGLSIIGALIGVGIFSAIVGSLSEFSHHMLYY